MTDTEIIIYAVRYCLLRRSYAWHDGLDLAEHNWDDLDDATKGDVIESVRTNGDALGFRPGFYPTIARALWGPDEA